MTESALLRRSLTPGRASQVLATLPVARPCRSGCLVADLQTSRGGRSVGAHFAPFRPDDACTVPDVARHHGTDRLRLAMGSRRGMGANAMTFLKHGRTDGTPGFEPGARQSFSKIGHERGGAPDAAGGAPNDARDTAVTILDSDRTDGTKARPETVCRGFNVAGDASPTPTTLALAASFHRQRCGL